ncbi:MAG: hypothetical protein BJ554DRAFT_8312 [Olpidium bornovanus]|uniref:Uncharacterized protein n=1 Tax=Olpidium bornovanus TaxID=278681 RepID=A0A8H7ZVD9_9FUNG|nr:MAG: hypothetical protein BJ554DRAFT_8312 [Olpidium bornovanus]
MFVIVASIAYFRQTVRPAQALGILLTFVGLWMYHSAKMETGGEGAGGGGGGGGAPEKASGAPANGTEGTEQRVSV